MFKAYVASALLALGLFTWAQYHGWSVYSQNEGKPTPGTARSAYHK